ncbi:excisionase [Serratia fonticola]|uniref:excisionase n=1 Tax=Serratia TaxID=613 RepID=UPI001A07DEA9|nr:excisionase [Serratia sp. PL7]MBE0150239.1 excisionase [Serratia fonticola]
MGNNVKFLTLEEWSHKVYSSDFPTKQTLQRWARGGYIYPAPEKHGRVYRVREDAIYINPKNYRLSKQIVADSGMKLPPLMERLLNGNGTKKKRT